MAMRPRREFDLVARYFAPLAHRFPGGELLQGLDMPITAIGRMRMAAGRHLPRLHRITVTFGHSEPVTALRLTAAGRSDEERIADALHQRAARLAAAAAAGSEAGHPISKVSFVNIASTRAVSNATSTAWR